MAIWRQSNWFKHKRSKMEELQARIDELESKAKIQGYPVNVVEGPENLSQHYDKERNAARVSQLEAAIAQFRESGQPDHPKVPELSAELTKHLKIKQVFHSDEEE